jgi:hypothetical protein
VQLIELPCHIDTALAVRQAQIHDRERRALPRGRRQRFGGIVCNRGPGMSRLFHQVLQVDGDEHLVLDDQDFCPHVAVVCSGKVMWAA